MYIASTTRLSLTALFAAVMLSMSGCLKDTCTSSTPSKIYTPLYAPLTSLRAAVKSEAPRDIQAPGKIYIYGNYIFLNELNKGIHIIDDTNPSAPQKIAFINIPGNVDMAVKGNTLYADSYIDMVALDISDPHNIRETKRLEFVFPQRQYEYGITNDTTSGLLIVGFKEKDTILTNTCKMDNWNGQYLYDGVSNSAVVTASYAKTNTASSVAMGKGGSTARFALRDNYLYTVDNYGLQLFNVATPTAPVKRNNIPLGAMVETIFPYNDNLFIGTTTGMLIYSVSNPEYPVQKGVFSHVTSCDPVVVEGTTAYVTLRSGVTCRATNINELDILDVTDVTKPVLKSTIQMTNPYGLGVDGDNVFVCDGTSGLKFMDVSHPASITIKKTVTGIEPTDVIPFRNILLVTAKDGLYQYDYSNLENPKLLSKIGITVVK